MDYAAHPLVDTAWLEAYLSEDDLCQVGFGGAEPHLARHCYLDT